MSKHALLHTRSIIRGSILVVLFLMLFTLTHFVTVAHAQPQPGFYASFGVSLQPAPPGTADLRWNPHSQALTVILHLKGLQPGSHHAAHIHAGTCKREGKILYSFKPIIASAAGTATVTTTLPRVTGGIPATGWHITVHRGATAKTGDLLCGDITNPKHTSMLVGSLHASP